MSTMVNEQKEQLLLWRSAFMAIGRALRHEFECDQRVMRDHIRQLLAQLHTIGKPKSEGPSS
jgi:hypothetical protein